MGIFKLVETPFPYCSTSLHTLIHIWLFLPCFYLSTLLKFHSFFNPHFSRSPQKINLSMTSNILFYIGTQHPHVYSTRTHSHALTYTPSHIHTHAYTHAYIHTCIHTYIHTYTHIHVLTHTYTHARMHTHAHARTHTRTCTHASTHTCRHTHTRTHTHRVSIINKY